MAYDLPYTGAQLAQAVADTGTLKDRMAAVEAGQAQGFVGFADKATMDADLNYPDKTLAKVTDDTTISNRGYYRKVGAAGTGSWAKAADPLRIMTREEFEALAADRRNTYAGSGFVEWGKHNPTGVVNQGIWNYLSTGYSNLIGWGRGVASGGTGVSKTEYPLANVNGHVLRVDSGYGGDNIAIPPAPADASLLDRQDLVFLEVWHEDISEKDFVFPFGNVQFGVASYTAPGGMVISTVAGTFLGYDTYPLVGNWQAPGAVVSRGMVWSTMTTAQQQAFVDDPANNVYRDGSTLVQVRYRVRVVQGLGSAWGNISPQQSNTNTAFLNYSTNSQYVIVKGSRISIAADLGAYTLASTDGQVFGGYYRTDTPIHDKGMFSLHVSGVASQMAYNGLCFAIPIALVQRRNQGAFHPVFNSNGTKGFGTATDPGATSPWYSASALMPNSTSDCFSMASASIASPGAIAGGSTRNGRPDGLYYDQVAEADVIDLRMSARKVTDLRRATQREFNKLVEGTTRGRGSGRKMPGSLTCRVYDYANGTISFAINGGVNDLDVLTGRSPQSLQSQFQIGSYFLFAYNGATYTLTVTGVGLTIQGTVSPAWTPLGAAGYYNITCIPLDCFIPSSFTSRQDLCCDIIGDTANYYRGKYDFLSSGGSQTVAAGQVIKVDTLTTGTGTVGHFYQNVTAITAATNLGTLDYANATNWIDLGTDRADSWWSNGVAGTPLLVDESGNLVSVTASSFKLSRKVSGSTLLALYSSDQGKTWTAASGTFNSSTNTSSGWGLGAGYILMIFYLSDASPLASAANAEALLIPEKAFASAVGGYGAQLGCNLVSALIGKVPTGTTASTMREYATVPLTEATLSGDGTGKLVANGGPNPVTHEAFSLASGLGPASKVAAYLTRSNGQLFLQLLYKEMIYNGTSWGDDGKFNVVDNDSTTTDLNGKTIRIGQKSVALPFFIDDAASEGDLNKSRTDVEIVIALGKPGAVVTTFLTDYLTGVALQPYLDAEQQYADLKAQPDQPDVPAVTDDQGNVITPAYSPNTIRDTAIAALEKQYPYLVDPGDGTTIAERRPAADLEQPEILAEAQELKTVHIKQSFAAEVAGGKCTLSLGWDIDCRRASGKDDIGNMQALLRIAQAQALADTDQVTADGIRGADNQSHPATVADLRDKIIPEMDQYGLGLYSRKWQLESTVAAAKKTADVLAVEW